MLRVCGNSLPKHPHTSRGNTGHGRVPVAHLRSRHGPPRQVSVIQPPKGFKSIELNESTTKGRLSTLSPLIRNLRVPDKRIRAGKALSGRPTVAGFFAQLSYLLANQNVRGTTLWYFVKRSCTPSRLGGRDAFTESQKSLFGQVLRRVLAEWATEGMNSGSIRLITVIRGYVARNFMRPKDWVYCLGFLARAAYQNINLRRDQPLRDVLGGRIGDAINLRVLCKAWSLFLLGHVPHTSKPVNRARTYEHLWPRFRDGQAQTRGVEDGEDYVQRFVSRATGQSTSTDPGLDRYLAYSSVLTLVALYSSIRTFAVDSVHAPKGQGCSFPQSGISAGGEGASSDQQPNWHLGHGQSTHWTPTIGHLSMSEASILYIIAEAADNATLNLTLLRITLAQMLLPESEAQEIARTYQGFKLAIPAIVGKFRDFKYDTTIYRAGLLRRYPLKAYVQSAVSSNDIGALEHAGAVAKGYGAAKTAPGDALALVKAFLRMDRPRRALRYWNALAQRADLETQAWRLWLDHAFQKKDHVAYETAWDILRTRGIQRTSEMWYQRLLLLHQTNQSSDAWTHFCTLVRYSGKNEKLRGEHIPRIAPSTVDIRIFHMMIEAYVEQKSERDVGIAKAGETLELLRKHKGLEVTRETYMLFIDDFLKRDARQSAIEWFHEGRSRQIKFLPKDYALLFEHDLGKHDKGQSWPLSDFSSNIRQCFDAISAVMRLVRGGRLFTQPSSSNIESMLQGMPLIDSVNVHLKKAKIKEAQSLYAGLIQHLAQNFAEERSGRAKTARLRLLLLLWDHCIMTGIPASAEMESILRSTVYSIHAGLQEKLMRGALFNNYDVRDPLSFHSYKFLRLVGGQWFTERIGSIPPGPTKSQLASLPWNGYDALTEKTLTDAGIASQEDRRKILDEIVSWKNVATTKRADSVKKRKGRQREISIRRAEFKGLAEIYDDMARQLRLSIKRQADQIRINKRRISRLKGGLKADRIRKGTERRVVFEVLRVRSSGASTKGDTDLLSQSTRGFQSLRSHHRAIRKQSSIHPSRSSTPRSTPLRTASDIPTVSTGEWYRRRTWRRRGAMKDRFT